MRRRCGLCAGAVLLILLVRPVAARAQLPPPEPDRFAVSIGGEAVFPSGDLAARDPNADTWYAESGSALVERFAWAPFPALAVYLEATFPRFGMDVAALQADFGSDPPVVEGRNDITAWSLGARWRPGGEWFKGPWVEASVGRFRQRVETTQEGTDPASNTFEWEYGLSAAAGWTVRLGPAFGLEAGAVLRQFTEENRGTLPSTGDPYLNRWTDRWLGVRVLALITFGGEG